MSAAIKATLGPMAVVAVRPTMLATDHRIGCPVVFYPDDPAWAARVETYRTGRPARMESRDGLSYPVPPEALIAVHCMECGNIIYVKE